MAKRTVTKIGDVFCVEIDDKFKCYFQYICNDLTMMNSSVICVFKTRYSIDYIPVLEDIVKDDVSFYAHTILRVGIEEKTWYKVGKAKPADEGSKNVIFGFTQETLYINGEIIDVNPLEHWTLWKMGYNFVEVGVMPLEYRNSVEYGSIVPYNEIVARIKLGYYTYQSPVYSIIKRIPHPDVDSFTSKKEGVTTVLSHFKGENVVQEIILSQDGNAILSEGNPLDRPKFWETNWKYREWITEQDFMEVWNKYKTIGKIES